MLSKPVVIIITLIAAAIAAAAQYIFKRHVPKFKFSMDDMLSLAKNRKLIAGVVVYVVGLAFYLLALNSGELSFVYPAFSSTFIFVIVISHFKLKEPIGYARMTGILFIIIGIFMVSVAL